LRHYKQIQFNTFNHFGGMIRLALSCGYAPVGVSQHFGSRWDIAIRFDKPLVPEARPPHVTNHEPADLSQPAVQIGSDHPDDLRHALDRGFAIRGVVGPLTGARPLVLLHQIQSEST
jgi:hypothetical protein